MVTFPVSRHAECLRYNAAVRPAVRRSLFLLALVLSGLMAGRGIWIAGWLAIIRLLPPSRPPSPQQVAAAQAAFDAQERPSGVRGDAFFQLASTLDLRGRGSMTEQQIVQRLGNPDGVIGPAGSRSLIYYYVPSDGEASFVAVDLRVNVLLHMGYNDASQLPRSALQPYRPPQPNHRAVRRTYRVQDPDDAACKSRSPPP